MAFKPSNCYFTHDNIIWNRVNIQVRHLNVGINAIENCFPM